MVVKGSLMYKNVQLVCTEWGLLQTTSCNLLNTTWYPDDRVNLVCLCIYLFLHDVSLLVSLTIFRIHGNYSYVLETAN